MVIMHIWCNAYLFRLYQIVFNRKNKKIECFNIFYRVK